MTRKQKWCKGCKQFRHNVRSKLVADDWDSNGNPMHYVSIPLCRKCRRSIR